MSEEKGHSIKVVYPGGKAAVQTGARNKYYIDGKQFDYVTNLDIAIGPDRFNHVSLSFLVREVVFEEEAN